jgi:succinate dehydrogenase/fumarate reductase-like Fe-S protein
MTQDVRSGQQIELLINGVAVRAEPHMTVVEASWAGNVPRVTGIGCLEGVCGSCRILVRRGQDVGVSLACETVVEDGMEAVFLPAPSAARHQYDLSSFSDGWDVQARFHETFPEVSRCRHCHGCVKSCPKGIVVEDGVALAAAGRFREAGELFLECVMCGLCDGACPERIAPAHVGLFCRRITAFFHLRPPNLIHRLEETRQQLPGGAGDKEMP